MTSKISRRTLVFGSVATASLAAVGGIGLASADATATCRAALHRLVGPFTMKDAAFEAFVRDFRDDFGFLEGMPGRVLGLGEISGVLPAFAGSMPVAAEDRVERFERALLTNFIFRTDYLQLGDPRREAVDYVGRIEACGNPFAQFD